MDIKIDDLKLLMNQKLRDITLFSNEFLEIFNKLGDKVKIYENLVKANADKRDINVASEVVLILLHELHAIRVPNLDLNILLRVKYASLIFLHNEDLQRDFNTFTTDYNKLFNDINEAFDKIKVYFNTFDNKIFIEYFNIKDHDPTTLNYLSLQHHKNVLDTLSIERKTVCEGRLPAVDDIYVSLDRINYENNTADYSIYIDIQCMVMKILERNKDTFLKGLLFESISIENNGIQLELVDHKVISDTSVEGVVWTVGFHNPRPFATMKYSKPRYPKDYNMVHELVIGLALNKLRNRTSSFMYVWGGFSCNIPEQVGFRPLLPGVVPGQGGGVQANHEFGTLCSNNTSQNIDTIVLAEAIDVFGTFDDIVTHKKVISLPSFYILILQILEALEIAQRECKFVHGDLHRGNVLIKKLGSQINITIGGTVYPTRYIPIIIDYGLARMEVYGHTILPLLYNWNGGDRFPGVYAENFQQKGEYMPLYDIARLLERLSIYPFLNKLDQVLSKNMYIVNNSIFGLRDMFARGLGPLIYTSRIAQPMKKMKENLMDALRKNELPLV